MRTTSVSVVRSYEGAGRPFRQLLEKYRVNPTSRSLNESRPLEGILNNHDGHAVKRHEAYIGQKGRARSTGDHRPQVLGVDRAAPVRWSAADGSIVLDADKDGAALTVCQAYNGLDYFAVGERATPLPLEFDGEGFPLRDEG